MKISGSTINKTGARKPGVLGGSVALACHGCSNKFEIRRAEYNRGGGKFCSMKCCREATASKKFEFKCCHCNETFYVSRDRALIAKFCSTKCKKTSQIKVRSDANIAQRRLEVRIASLMGYSLKGLKAGCKWESLVGYTLHDLMAHLEKLFVPGMSWSNIGEWHIDHRKPRSAFVYTSHLDPAFQECWALNNLQPLWAVDNMRKGARLDWSQAA